MEREVRCAKHGFVMTDDPFGQCPKCRNERPSVACVKHGWGNACPDPCPKCLEEKPVYDCGHAWQPKNDFDECPYCKIHSDIMKSPEILELKEKIKKQQEIFAQSKLDKKPHPANEPDKKFVDTYNYNHRRKTLISYLRMKTDEGDWHACSDAANDLRVLEAGNK